MVKKANKAKEQIVSEEGVKAVLEALGFKETNGYFTVKRNLFSPYKKYYVKTIMESVNPKQVKEEEEVKDE